MTCVLWRETQEPGMVTQAPPTGDNINGGDEDDDNWTPGATTYSDPEAGESDSDYEDYGRTVSSIIPSALDKANLTQTTSNAGSRASNVPAPVPGTRQTPSVATSSVGPRQHITVPYDSLATLSLNGTNTTSNPGTGHTIATANLPTPNMSGVGTRIAPGSTLMSGSGVASGSRNTATQRSFDIRSQSSASNPYETVSGTPGWGAMDARRRDPATQRPNPATFTGWDNRGQPHIQQRFPSESGSQTQQSTSASATSALPAATVPGPTRNSNWARPVGSRGAQRTMPPPDGIRSGNAGRGPISRPLAESRSEDDSDTSDDLNHM
ncbi:hypothetical protein ONS96_005183 [Cadophora gregata f. sp. sojae]|nr:hypothetical protein ONS96_005183 [Cadophora gregata f. sp. sojae]